jgi:hypothetical protein
MACSRLPTVARTQKVLPALVLMARQFHGSEAVPVQRAIVLEMWRVLAGEQGWTAPMITAVERRIR